MGMHIIFMPICGSGECQALWMWGLEVHKTQREAEKVTGSRERKQERWKREGSRDRGGGDRPGDGIDTERERERETECFVLLTSYPGPCQVAASCAGLGNMSSCLMVGAQYGTRAQTHCGQCAHCT